MLVSSHMNFSLNITSTDKIKSLSFSDFIFGARTVTLLVNLVWSFRHFPTVSVHTSMLMIFRSSFVNLVVYYQSSGLKIAQHFHEELMFLKEMTLCQFYLKKSQAIDVLFLLQFISLILKSRFMRVLYFIAVSLFFLCING